MIKTSVNSCSRLTDDFFSCVDYDHTFETWQIEHLRFSKVAGRSESFDRFAAEAPACRDCTDFIMQQWSNHI